jgi:hypothetical protein
MSLLMERLMWHAHNLIAAAVLRLAENALRRHG